MVGEVPDVEDFRVLGLSWQKTNDLLYTEKDIKKAFMAKALVTHPDKNIANDDPHAHAKFQKLKSSYEKLKRWVVVNKDKHQGRRMARISEMDEREREYVEKANAAKKAREDDERTSCQLKEEIAQVIRDNAAKRRKVVVDINLARKNSSSEATDGQLQPQAQQPSTSSNLFDYAAFEKSVLEKCKKAAR